MDVFDAIRTRRSIRQFSDTPVEWENVVKILEAGSLAPSSGNIQNWRFIVVTGKEVKAKLADACLEQLWIENAPVIIVVISENITIEKLYGKRGKELYAKQNCAAAIENMLLTAHSLGLGACWVGAFEDEAVRRVLSVPEQVSVEAVIPIGYSIEKPPEPMHYSLENITFFEEYGNKIKDLDAVMWNFNALGRTIHATKTVSNHVKKKTHELIKKIVKKNKKE